MTVIEVRGRGGQLIERFRTEQEQISIGRAFDNDVILEDAYVSAHHLRLTFHPEGWVAEDLDSANGVQYRKQKIQARQHITSGDRLRVGHTYLYVYEDSHSVSPVLKVDSAETRLVILGRHSVWPILIVLSCAIMVFDSYTRSFIEYKPLKLLQPALWSLLGVVMLSVVWALVGRLVRHRAYFFSHLSIWYLFGIALFCANYVTDIVAYNLSSSLVQDILARSAKFLLLLITLWSSLTLATNLMANKRLWSAFGLAAVVMLVGIAGEFRWQRDFNAAPSYYAQMKSPVFLWVKSAAGEKIVTQLPELLARATEEAEKDDEAEVAFNGQQLISR